MTLADGSATGAGGAIYSAADQLTVEKCQITDSAATTDGGGIYATGTLNLFESTVADSSAAEGGGLALDGATAFIRQSTLSGNSATSGTGGGLLIEGTASAVTILQSTIADNDASTNGGGIRIAAGNLLLHNTIVADNTATTANPDVYGTVLSDSSYNLIGDGTGLTGITNDSSGNQIGTGAVPIDAKLGDLDDHGGPTETHSLRVGSPALDAGSDSGVSFQLAILPMAGFQPVNSTLGLLTVTHLARTSTVEYDMLGRTAQVTQIDPDGIGTAAAPVTTYTYDANGNILAEIDPLDNTTTHTYDALGRKTKTTDAEGGETEFTYDAVARMTSLTDPEDNTTSWAFDPLGRVATETITVSSTDLVRTFRYDALGNLTRKIDRNERVIDFSYDSLSRKTTETWYDDVTDADAEQNVRKTYSTTYDDAGRAASVGDGSYDFEYTYSMFGQLTSTTQDLNGLSDDVVFTYAYDALGRKREVTAAIGTTDDYVNTYAYDSLHRVTQITQSGVTGGNSVAEKRVNFGYSDDNTRATISRFADLAGTKSVAETDKVFDQLGRVTDIVHDRATTEFADYDLAWNAGSQLTAFDFTSLVGDDGDADYTYDDTSQLTDADYDFRTDEAYTYDDNGNRTITGYTTGDHNRLTSDGTYNYTYDDEGNVTSKANISTSESVEYTWDHRNRLTKVTFKNSSGTPTKIVEYAYDHGQRWVRKTLDSNADSTIDESRIFVHDAGQIVLDFEKTGTGDASNADLSHRYLWASAVDQILADETVDDGTGDDVAWTLTDHLNSVRDLVEYNPGSNTTSVIKHVTYDAFGNVTSDSATGVDSLFLYTARPYDDDGELQNNLNRWYDLSTGRWMSMDPIGFEAGDVNLYRHVGNRTTQASDPMGLLTNIEFAAPRMDGTAGVVGTWEEFEDYLDLEVDGKVMYSARNEGTQTFMGSFDYNWLKRPKPNASVTGEIVIYTCARTHVLSYTGTHERWSQNTMEFNWASTENLGLSLSTANATGEYTKYSGDVHNQAAVWDTTILLSAKWTYHKAAGDGNAVLVNPTSVFGAQKKRGRRMRTGIWTPPPEIGPNNRPKMPREYTDTQLNYTLPFNRWFVHGATWDTAHIKTSLTRSIDTGVGGRTFVDILEFELPGVPLGN